MAVEFGTLPRQHGLDELLGDLAQLGNNPGAWAKVRNALVDEKGATIFANRWKQQRILGIDTSQFEAISINGDLWMRAKTA